MLTGLWRMKCQLPRERISTTLGTTEETEILWVKELGGAKESEVGNAADYHRQSLPVCFRPRIELLQCWRPPLAVPVPRALPDCDVCVHPHTEVPAA